MPESSKAFQLKYVQNPSLVRSPIFVRSIIWTDTSVKPECPSGERCEYKCSPKIPSSVPSQTYSSVLSLMAGSGRPNRSTSYPSPAAYFCLSIIYINKQNVVLPQIVVCYQFPPCNHLKNWLLFSHFAYCGWKSWRSDKKWHPKYSYATFPMLMNHFQYLYTYTYSDCE